MISFQIKGNLFNAIFASAAKKDIRYYLNGVCVDTKASKLIGTTGLILSTMPVEFSDIDEREQVIIPHPPKKPNKTDKVMVYIDDKMVTYIFSGQEFSLRIVDGQFPQWQAIVDDGRKTEVTDLISFNPELITPIQKALGSVGVDFRFTESKRIDVSFKGTEELKTILASMR